MRRLLPILLVTGLLFWPCSLSDSLAEEGGANRAPSGVSFDASLDKLIAQLPQVDSEGKWDEEKKEYVENSICCTLRGRLARGGKMTDAQWRKALLDSGAIRIRDRWPEGEDFAISMRKPGWLGVAEIRMKPRTKGLKEAKAGMLFESTCGFYSNCVYQKALYQPLGMLPLGKHKIVFDVIVERGKEDGPFREKEATKPPPPSILWKGDMAFDIEVVTSIDECVLPVTTPPVDEAVRKAVGVAFTQWYFEGEPRPTAILVIDPDAKDYPVLVDMALSLTFEILKDGRAVDECHLTASTYDPIALAASVSKGDRQSIGFRSVNSVPAALKDKKEDRKNWSVRISGTSKDVIYLWEAKCRWSGSVEVPVDELIERERERTKGKERVWVYSPTLR